MSDRASTVRLALALAVGWAALALWLISPVDAIPDVLPVVGWLDDLLVVVAGLGATAWFVGRPVLERLTADPRPSLEGPTAPADGYEPWSVEDIRAL
ncbi:MAG: DUF1232 domain-containing protein [Alphaproteobacteria bacterium]|nr:DUF1232 domain-containing protein [Alphaproteobacteria bacterium]MCB9698354.1 DUF1232 domain-containing protein [Alphaproteobacteria bacterium]